MKQLIVTRLLALAKATDIHIMYISITFIIHGVGRVRAEAESPVYRSYATEYRIVLTKLNRTVK